jgi:hypothetical protein
MRQIMRFTMSDKSVSAALAAICKDRCANQRLFCLGFLPQLIEILQPIRSLC